MTQNGPALVHPKMSQDASFLSDVRHSFSPIPRLPFRNEEWERVMRFLLLAAAVILVRDPTGKWANDPLHPWFESLRNNAGLYCCAKADGHPLDDGQWDMKGNSYRVFLHGEWIVVPADTVISGPNKLGKAVVWFQKPGELAWGGDTTTPILCFIPGSEV